MAIEFSRRDGSDRQVRCPFHADADAGGVGTTTGVVRAFWPPTCPPMTLDVYPSMSAKRGTQIVKEAKCRNQQRHPREPAKSFLQLHRRLRRTGHLLRPF